MNNPEKILHGFLEISVSGDQLERFLNLCHARAVSLERIRYLSEKNITTRISINDFRKLLPIHRKTRVRIHILKKRRSAVFAAQNPKTQVLYSRVPSLCGLAVLAFWPHLEYPY